MFARNATFKSAFGADTNKPVVIVPGMASYEIQTL
jgi:hypothetical protein